MSTNRGQQTTSLDDFSFDTNDDFFPKAPEKGKATSVNGVMQAVKGATLADDDDDDDDTPPTSLEDDTKGKGKVDDDDDEEEVREQKPKPSPKKAAPKKKEEEETNDDDDDDLDDDFNFENPDASKPKKPAAKGKEDVAGEDDEEEVKPTKGKKKEEEEVEETDEEFFSALVNDLRERKVFEHVEIEEGEKIDEEKFFELQGKEIDARVDDVFAGFVEEIPQDGKDFINHLRKGGSVVDFFAVYNTGSIDLDGFDSAKPDQVQAALRHYLVNQEGLDAEELEDRLTYYKDGGKEVAMAEKFVNRMIKAKDENKARLEKQVAKAEADAEKRATAFKNEIKSILNSSETIGAFPISKKEQVELDNFINKPTVKVGKNKYVPELQMALARILKAETKEDKEGLIILSKLVKNKFDIGDIVAKTQTKVTQRARAKITEYKAGQKKGSSSGVYTKKSLGDYFDE